MFIDAVLRHRKDIKRKIVNEVKEKSKWSIKIEENKNDEQNPRSDEKERDELMGLLLALVYSTVHI